MFRSQSCSISKVVLATMTVGKHILLYFSTPIITIFLFLLHISALCQLVKLGNAELYNAVHFDRLGITHAEAMRL